MTKSRAYFSLQRVPICFSFLLQFFIVLILRISYHSKTRNKFWLSWNVILLLRYLSRLQNKSFIKRLLAQTFLAIFIAVMRVVPACTTDFGCCMVCKPRLYWLHCTKISKHIVPEMKLRGLIPNSYMFLWEIYIFPRSVLNRSSADLLWEFTNCSQIH